MMASPLQKHLFVFTLLVFTTLIQWIRPAKRLGQWQPTTSSPRIRNNPPGEQPVYKDVAICIMLTTTAVIMEVDLNGSLDGASVLRQSVLSVYNLTDDTSHSKSSLFVYKAPRTVGLPPYNPNHTASINWMQPRVENVTIFEFPLTDSTSIVRLRFIAMVDDNVPAEWQMVAKKLGFEIWKTRPPLENTEIRNADTQERIVRDGAIGIKELIKLEGLRMTDFDKVLFVDCDVMFHHRFDELIEMPENFGWSKGGWDTELVNGGYLVYSPKHPSSLVHMEHIMEVLREGDFVEGTGWRGSGIGYMYGGRTIQGILPYYYFVEANRVQQLMIPSAHREIDNCRHNTMLHNQQCKTLPFEDIVSNHFSGECQKPWRCQKDGWGLCHRFRQEFGRQYREVILDVAKREPALVSNNMLQYANKLGPNEWCLDGDRFDSLSASMYENIVNV